MLRVMVLAVGLVFRFALKLSKKQLNKNGVVKRYNVSQAITPANATKYDVFYFIKGCFYIKF